MPAMAVQAMSESRISGQFNPIFCVDQEGSGKRIDLNSGSLGRCARSLDRLPYQSLSRKGGIPANC